ncbi:MAG: hypothetical protein KatS3mg051_2137 [Anaerolineae bacterium]|nr:MAG: hypothetical protein KatS3mg051_2137 [Anaerolineae bacterium]
MAFTTYSALMSALGSLSVTGVTRTSASAPRQLNTADLPYMFPRVPAGESEVATLVGGRGLRQATAELVIVVEPVLQNVHSANVSAVAALVDNLDTALADNVNDLGLDGWSLRVEQDLVGDTAYWMLVATLEVSG